MSNDAGQLLRQLEPAVRPSAASPSTAASANPPRAAAVSSTDQLPFADLIEQAMKGTLATGRPVTIAPGIDVPKVQLEQIASAADRAEAAGSRKAIVVFHRRSYVMDVPARKLIRAVENHRLDELAMKSARAGRVRLDNPGWLVRIDDNVDGSGRTSTELAPSSTIGVATSTKMGSSTEQPINEIVQDIDTAIFMNAMEDDNGSAESAATPPLGALSADRVWRMLHPAPASAPWPATQSLDDEPHDQSAASVRDASD